MSSMNTSSRKGSVLQLNKKFCKVCQDAGKTEPEYTSHNVRDSKNGKVLCPLLLAQECRNCFKKGHTIKYCKQSQTPVPTPAPTVKQTSVAKVIAPKNIFDMLNGDSEDEEEPHQQLMPCPVTNVELKATINNALNYKDLITKNKFVVDLPQVVKTKIRQQVITPAACPVIKNNWIHKKIDWGNCDSGSDEEEEEDEY